MKAVHPYLNFGGNTEEALNFYKSVFGTEFHSIVRFRDMPMEGAAVPESDQDKIMHIALPIAKNTLLMATDCLESLGQQLTVGNNSYIYLGAESKEEANTIFKQLSENGNIEMDMADVPWGSYFGSFKDQFGVNWMVEYEYPK